MGYYVEKKEVCSKALGFMFDLKRDRFDVIEGLKFDNIILALDDDDNVQVFDINRNKLIGYNPERGVLNWRCDDSYIKTIHNCIDGFNITEYIESQNKNSSIPLNKDYDNEIYTDFDGSSIMPFALMILLGAIMVIIILIQFLRLF